VDEHGNIEVSARKRLRDVLRCIRMLSRFVASVALLDSTCTTPPSAFKKKWCVVAVCEKPIPCSPPLVHFSMEYRASGTPLRSSAVSALAHSKIVEQLPKQTEIAK